MTSTSSFAADLRPWPLISWARRPPRPPLGLVAVLHDQFDTSSKLEVVIDAEDLVTVRLHSTGLEASGAAVASVRRYGDDSALAMVDVALTGFDSIAARPVQGTVNLGIAWAAERRGRRADVGASALAEGNWIGGPLRFNVVHQCRRRVRTLQFNLMEQRACEGRRTTHGVHRPKGPIGAGEAA